MKEWVLILGCSTGHGGATTRKLAENGYGIIGFHFDRGDIKKEAKAFCEELKGINDGGNILRTSGSFHWITIPMQHRRK